MRDVVKTYRTIIWILSSLCLLGVSAGAQETASKKAPQVLAELEARLQPIIGTTQYEEVERLQGNRRLFLSLLPKTSIPKIDKIVRTPNSESPDAVSRWPLEIGWQFDDIIYLEITEGSDRDYSGSSFGTGISAVWRPEKTIFRQRYNLVPSPEIDKFLTGPKRKRMSAETVNPQRDHWVYEAFTYLSKAGFTPGYPAEFFDIKKPLTRLDAALVLAAIFRSTAPINIGPNEARGKVKRVDKLGISIPKCQMTH